MLTIYPSLYKKLQESKYICDNFITVNFYSINKFINGYKS